MQFVNCGPDIPDALLQAQEEGRVIFFCGAGISYPAGLPGFKDLVNDIYRSVGTTRTAIEDAAFEREQFDATLDLLERRLPGQRVAVRTALMQVLQPKLRRKGATDTHAALLQLARSRKGELRLVTTNFDRIFECVAKRNKQQHNSYVAPMLPIPKDSRWNGLVYLHGMLPVKADDTILNRLVVTSGDFGLAYLIERWAARFVSELFRNYIVCFVGYSINDPILRYMMDALAADRLLGEESPQAYALAGYKSGVENVETVEWEAKGVVPILYEVPEGTHDHSALHNTLRAWAKTYRDGVLGKERLVIEYALAKPSASTVQDNFVGRMLWALSDPSGLPAKCLADFNPVPSLDWLKAFSTKSYQHHDLRLFGISPCDEVSDQLKFSLILRPTSYEDSSWMGVASKGRYDSQWDNVMSYLAHWLVRHLNDPELVVWLAEQGGQLHDRLNCLIDQKLEYFSRLQQEGKTSELSEIRAQSPNAIPSDLMQVLWRFFLAGRIKSFGRDHDLYRWSDRLKRDGLTTILRLELRELLAPRITLRRRTRWGESNKTTEGITNIKQLVDWELVLAASHVNSTIQGWTDANWQAALPELLGDFQQLLRDSLDLFRELDYASDISDHSSWDLPSISPHWQNRGYHDWVTLIELVRDAWLSVKVRDLTHSIRIAQAWFDLPYPTFKRLALFAASVEGCIAPEEWVDWLLVNDAWWLWSGETKRETMRLLVQQGGQLSTQTRDKLEASILMGPPRRMFRDNIDAESLSNIVDRSVWLRLAKLQSSGEALSAASKNRLAELSGAYPQWQLKTNESDEFQHWMSSSGDPDGEDLYEIEMAPRNRSMLVAWLKQSLHQNVFFYEDTWRETCSTRFFHCLGALFDLSAEGIWPANPWQLALQAWSDDANLMRSWHYAAPLVQTLPDNTLQEISHSVTWWLMKVSKSIERHESILFDLCRKVLALPLEASSGITENGKPINQPVDEAINHPIGHVTTALLELWLKEEPNDNDGLSSNVEPFFTLLCNTKVDRFRHGRVLLASRLITFIRVDFLWTSKNLLPLLDWTTNPIEARAAWEGFLWSPRLYPPLLIAFKPQFLETASHYVELDKHGRQFATFLTYMALAPIDGYTEDDFRMAVSKLPPKGLEDVVHALVQALGGVGDQREEYWKNRVKPFWQNVFPKSRDFMTPRMSELLVQLCLASGEEFESVVSTVDAWLQPLEHPGFFVRSLHNSGCCERFPVSGLRLLSLVVGKKELVPSDLEGCLEAIIKSDASLRTKPSYLLLHEYSRHHSF